MKSLRVHLLPSLTSPQEIAGGALVVIDILRASTTIVTALAAGASEVIPCLEIADAREIAKRKEGAKLCGERGGLPIEGFDLGNSPAEYTADRVAGRPLILTTTNGTRALMLGMGASEVLIGAFVNLSALCRRLAAAERVELLCAGTDGHITLEDILFAGAVAARLVDAASAGDEYSLNDAAHLALAAWRTAERGESAGRSLADWLALSRGGRNLLDIGHGDDLPVAANIDRFDLVPLLDRRDWTLRPA